MPPARVHLLVNASHAAIREALEAAAAEATGTGVFWVYFAGHGAGAPGPDGATERALVGRSAEADARIFADFLVPLSQVQATARGSKARDVVVILDACYANAGRTGQPLLGGRYLVPDSALAPTQGMVVWSAVSRAEVAEPYDAARHGVFTYYVLSALQGHADGALGARDGKVTLAEAEAWTTSAVRITANHRQNPEIVWDPRSGALALGSVPKGLTPLDPTTLPAIAAAAPGSSLQAELERLRRQQEAARAQADDKSARREAARASLLDEAARTWEQVVALSATPGDPAGELALRKYIQAWESATITVDGVTEPVSVPQVDQARQRLEGHAPGAVGRPWGRITLDLGVSAVGVAGLAGAVVFGLQAADAHSRYAATENDAEASVIYTDEVVPARNRALGALGLGLAGGLTGPWLWKTTDFNAAPSQESRIRLEPTGQGVALVVTR